ncbi:MAG: ATP-dependent RNA helicase HrpA [Pseudomonadota bacterium]
MNDGTDASTSAVSAAPAQSAQGAGRAELARLLAGVDQAMVVDRHPLRRMLAGRPDADTLVRAAQRLNGSQARYAARASSVPALKFDEQLPVSARRAELANVLDRHQVVVVCGETGSGKTTQLPKILLEIGRGRGGLIGHTQPRRIAARTVAARIAEELGSRVGDLVGYQVRFVDEAGPNALVKLMTDGVLLAELARDRYLNAYDTIIVDEAHERSLNIDFILGYLRRLLPKRPDLKVVITSATIDPARFAGHFNDAPVVEVSGRGYPVEVRYQPLSDDGEQDAAGHIGQAVRDAIRHGPGDILVFLPGEREIRDTSQFLRQMGLNNVEVVPFYARMGLAQQARIFAPGATRRIVLATNVAETSVTVPGISFVIDAGTARISRYSYRSKVQGLAVERISQASAEQRKGRCGRVGPGVCIRLYDEDDFVARDAYTDPEIRRTNLAAVILQMKALKLGDISRFPFIDPPDPRFVKDGYRLLRELGALDDKDRLTRVGRQLARLPLDPRLGRMLLAAADTGAVAETLTIAAALSVVDPRERPLDLRDAADQAHRRYADKRSDFVTWLNLWEAYQKQQREGTRAQLRQWCKDQYLSYIRMREWAEVRRQLKSMVAELGIAVGEQAAQYDELHRGLLTGLLSQVGVRHEESGFKGTRGSRFHIFPGSGVKMPGPKWVVAANLMQTRRLYAHGVAGIQPQWIEHAAAHLVSRRHHEPRWDPRRGEVVATEQVTFLGLVLAADRRVAFARIDAHAAHEIFIQEALVRGRTADRPPFLEQNLALVEEIRELERRLRRADLVVDDDWQCAFYRELLPGDICNMRALRGHLKRAARDEREALLMQRDQVLVRAEADREVDAFPPVIDFGEHRLPLVYGFEPGNDGDGVTVKVPLAILNQLDPRRGEWLVPGMLHEKIVALLRGLPKRYRRQLVPLPDFARACLEALEPGAQSLTVDLTDALERMTGIAVPADAWQVDGLPPHLQMRYAIHDSDSVLIVEGRDLAHLQREFGPTSADIFAALVRDGGAISGRRTWDFGELPARADFDAGGISISGFPAVVDEGDSVGVNVLQDAEASVDAHTAGVRRLFRLVGGRGLRAMPKRLPGLRDVAMLYGNCAGPEAPYCDLLVRDEGAQAELRDDLLDRSIDLSLGDVRAIRDQDAFRHASIAAEGEVGATLERLYGHVREALNRYLEYIRYRDRVDLPGRVDGLTDTDAQLRRLLHRRFVMVTPSAWLEHMPRYVAAATERLKRLDRDARQDTARLAEVLSVEAPVMRRIRAAGPRWRRDPDLVHLRWMVEELRVSMFAQQLKTSVPVSVKRVQKLLDELGERERLGRTAARDASA